jgi:hypothetical protein
MRKLELKNVKRSCVEVANYKQSILTISKGCVSGQDVDIICSVDINWNNVKYNFNTNPKCYEKTLFDIHCKRDSSLNNVYLLNIICFLEIGYIFTSDIRYFNEFLYFYDRAECPENIRSTMLRVFFENLSGKNQHKFPNASHEKINQFINNAENDIKLNNGKVVNRELKIALLGSPTFFKKIRNELLFKKFNVINFFIPFHPNKKINFLLKNKLLFKVLCLIKGVNFKFTRLSFNYKSRLIGKILSKKRLDIGFHKLGFIIKKNIYNEFRLGLINDHWGLLPFVRGRSTIEYSLLLNIPLAATTHLITKDIDDGSIVKIYLYSNIDKKYSKVRQIKSYIKNQMPYRAVDSIESLSKIEFSTIENHSNDGLMFYSMHPLLVDYIDENILKIE